MSDDIRCTKAGLACINTRSKRQRQAPRPKRSAKGRVAQLETRLDNILDLLGQRNIEGNDHTSSSSGIEQSRTASHSASQQAPTPYDATLWRWTAAPELEGHGDTMDQLDFGSLEEQIGSSTTSSDSFVLESVGLIVPASVLQYLITNFRQMAELFPFVQLPPNTSLQVMAETRPFLLLAAVTAAAYEYPKMQQIFYSEVKQIIMETVVGHGESSLDLLQGLLVHLAWFHFHSKRITGQRYTYLQLAISIARDLGIDDNIEFAFPDISRVDTFTTDGHIADNYSELDKDSLRAYLGCYFLSTTTASLSSKTNHLPLSTAMLRSAKFLDENEEFQTDRLIYPLLRLQSLAENVVDIYRLETSSSNLNRLHTHSHRLLGELESWKFSVAEDLADSVLLATRYHITKTQILEMGLVFSCPRTDPLRKPGSRISSTNSNYLEILANLVRSIDAVKSLYDDFLNIPPASYCYLPLSEWHHIIYATIVLYRLSTGLAKVAGWDAALAQQGMDLDEYLKLLIDHIRYGQSTIPTYPGPNRSLFSTSLDILESVRVSYASVKDHPQGIHDGVRAHETMQNGADSRQASTGSGRSPKCPGLRNLASRSDASSATMDASSTVDPGVLMEMQTMQHLAFWQGIFPEPDQVD